MYLIARRFSMAGRPNVDYVERLREWEQLGVHGPNITTYMRSNGRIPTTECLKHYLQALCSLGFRKPARAVQMYPKIIGMNFERVKEIIRLLKNAGIHDAVRVFENFPRLAGYSCATIQRRLSRVRDVVQCDDVNTFFKACPSALVKTRGGIEATLGALSYVGIGDPKFAIRSAPKLLSLSVTKILGKADLLEGEMHFSVATDVAGYISARPRVLCYSPGAISFRCRIVACLSDGDAACLARLFSHNANHIAWAAAMGANNKVKIYDGIREARRRTPEELQTDITLWAQGTSSIVRAYHECKKSAN